MLCRLKLLQLSLFLSFLFSFSSALAEDTLVLKVHFIYGSKPKKEFKHTEHKIFGGIHGGHVYMETNNKIVSFGTNNGTWHIFPHKSKTAGKYRVDKNLNWHNDTAKQQLTTVYIPITAQQYIDFKIAEKKYYECTPYDYAFIGMRCAAGGYDMLMKAGICKKKKRFGIITTNFYPKRLRVKLLHRAQKEKWLVTKIEGRNTRIWERD